MKIGWKKTGRAQDALPKTRLRDPLAVIPLTPQNLEQIRDSRGLLCLRLNVPVTGFRKLIVRWLGYKYEKKVELDEMGTRFYEQVDGRRTLREIMGGLVEKSGRSRQELAEHVVLFTRTLMVKNLILLKVTDENRIREA